VLIVEDEVENVFLWVRLRMLLREEKREEQEAAFILNS
jgi:hypothetical protein